MNGGTDLEKLKEQQNFWSGARYAAEELAWPIGILAGWVSYAEGLRWWMSVPIAIVVFFGVVRYFGRREEAAEDAYERATGTGKYWKG